MRKLALSDEILMKIEKPARYIGGEFNAIVKDHNEVDTTFCFLFSLMFMKLACHILEYRFYMIY